MSDEVPFEFAAAADSMTGDGVQPVEVRGKELLLCRWQGQWFCVSRWCSHAGQSLEQGKLVGGRIVCPHHGAAFELATGKPVSPPAFRGIRTYPVRVVEGRVEVAVRT